MNMQCRICNNEFEIGRLQIHLTKVHKVNIEEYYEHYINSQVDKKCPMCDKLKRFTGFANGYSKTCGNKSCTSKFINSIYKEKQRGGCKERNKKWKEEIVDGKTKQQLIIASGNELRKLKQEQTSIKISNALKEKDANGLTCLSRSFLEKYNVTNPMRIPEVVLKIRKTFRENYGVDWITQSEDVKNSIRSTMFEKRGVSNAMQDPSVVEKQKQNLLRKTGYSSVFFIPEIQKRIKETNLKNFGFESYLHTPEYKKYYHELNRKRMIEKILKYAEETNIEIISSLDNYDNNLDSDIIFKCKKCGTEYTRCWYSLFQYWSCRKCNPICGKPSSYEREICSLLDSHNVKYQTSMRFIRNPETNKSLELDIYIESKKLAFEIDGLYWHSNQFIIDPHYHLKKTMLCAEQGITLIHIFEDEIVTKKEIVLSRIRNLCGIITDKIYARKCIIKELDYHTKNNFLDQNHIQGQDRSRINLGLYFNDQLVSVMTFSVGNISKGSRKNDLVYELSRFCSLKDKIVVGSASKLLSYFKKNYQWNVIFSYADRRWSTGVVYNKLGFEFAGYTAPSYWYVNQIKRVHRFNYRKSVLKSKNFPFYKDELTEFEIMTLNNYIWIYDCGNLKFVMKNQ